MLAGNQAASTNGDASAEAGVNFLSDVANEPLSLVKIDLNQHKSQRLMLKSSNQEFAELAQ